MSLISVDRIPKKIISRKKLLKYPVAIKKIMHESEKPRECIRFLLFVDRNSCEEREEMTI